MARPGDPAGGHHRPLPALTGAGRAAAVDRLAAAGFLRPADEVDELLRAALDRPTLDRWVVRRERGEPLAWITGSVLFCGQRLHVAPGVYVPRAQTEELARRAAAALPPGGRALDLCTGAGAVAAHLGACVPSATVVGVDVDATAAACARRNGVPAMVADLDAAVAPARRFDVVTAVAPYVPTDAVRLLPGDVQRYEPRGALDGGRDGLDLVRVVIAAAGRLLRPGGTLFLELGGDQDVRLAAHLDAHGVTAADPWWDDDGDLRGLIARFG